MQSQSSPPSNAFPELILAAARGDLEKLKLLLADPNTDPNMLAPGGETALYAAAEQNRPAVVKELLKIPGIKLNTQNQYGSSPLYQAAQNGNFDIVRELLYARADPNIACPDTGATPLIVATRHEYLRIVRALLEGNANPNKTTNNGGTALMHAAELGNFQIVKELLAFGANPNKVYSTNETALSFAVKNVDLGMVRLLLGANADPNFQNGDGLTPLIMAVNSGDLLMVKELLKANADTSIPHLRTGFPPLFYAAVNNNFNILKELLAVLKIDLERIFTGDFKQLFEEAKTLDLRTIFGQRPIIKRLLKLGFANSYFYEDGTCFGIANKALLSILDETIDTFDALYYLLNLIGEENFLNFIEHAISNFYTPEETKKVAVNLKNYLKTCAIFQNYTSHESEFGSQYKSIKQNTLTPAQFFLSPQLKNKGGITQLDNFCGAYTLQELITYFDGLIKESNGIDLPFALLLRSGSHAIVIGFDPTHKQCLFVDGNTLPSRRFKINNSQQLAQATLEAFSDNEFAIFSTEIYSAKCGAEKIKKRIETWHDRNDWKIIHEINFEKATASDSDKFTLLHIAVKTNDLILLEKLLKNPFISLKIDLVSKRNTTPLEVAAIFENLEALKLLAPHSSPENKAKVLHVITGIGNLNLIKELLAANADVNYLIGFETAVYVAAKYGKEDILNEFIKLKNIRINIPHAPNPVYVAARYGYINIVRTLINHQAEIKKGVTYTLQELRDFAKNNNIEIQVEQFIAKKKIVSNIHVTPYAIAKLMGHTQIASMLKKQSKLARLSIFANNGLNPIQSNSPDVTTFPLLKFSQST